MSETAIQRYDVPAYTARQNKHGQYVTHEDYLTALTRLRQRCAEVANGVDELITVQMGEIDEVNELTLSVQQRRDFGRKSARIIAAAILNVRLEE